jgi:hypothetical protein
LLVDGLTPAFAQCSHREVVLELRDAGRRRSRSEPSNARYRAVRVDSREVERIVFDREFVNAVREEAGQSAMPVKTWKSSMPSRLTFRISNGRKSKQKTSGIGRAGAGQRGLEPSARP